MKTPNLLNFLLYLSLPAALLSTTVYVSPAYSGCNTTCAGTLTQPFDSIMNALSANQGTSLILILLPTPSKIHYWLLSETTPSGSTYYNYTSTTSLTSGTVTILTFASLTIKPFFCSESSGYSPPSCLTNSDNITIYMKNPLYTISANALNITNVIFDGSEDIYYINNLNFNSSSSQWVSPATSADLASCISARKTCCANPSSTGNSSLYSDVKCKRLDISFTSVPIVGPGSQWHVSGSNSQLLLTNSIIQNMWQPSFPYYIAFDDGSSITIQSTSVLNNFFTLRMLYANSVTSASIQISQLQYSDNILMFQNSTPSSFSIPGNSLFGLPLSNSSSVTLSVSSSQFSLTDYFMVFWASGTGTIVPTTFSFTSCNFTCTASFCKSSQLPALTDFQMSPTLSFNYIKSLTITNSTFTSLYGAMVLKSIPVLTFQSSNFTSNVGYLGGAITILAYSVGTRYLITGCVFSSNTAQAGGALYYHTNGASLNFTISGTTFVNNAARLAGGAIFISSQSTVGDTIYMSSLTVTNNTSPIGGGIFVDFQWVFDLSSSPSYSRPGSYQLQFSNSSFLNNTAPNVTLNFSSLPVGELYSAIAFSYPGVGGAIFYQCIGYCSATVSNCNFTSNVASLQGGAFYAGEVTASNCIFQNNSASFGGAIYGERLNFDFVPNASYVIQGCNFIANTGTQTPSVSYGESTGSGGAIFLNLQEFSVPVQISNCQFTQNSANLYGGSIYGNAFNLSSCSLNSSSAIYGGAIFGSPVFINNTNFTSNTAYAGNPPSGLSTSSLPPNSSASTPKTTYFPSSYLQNFPSSTSGGQGGAIYFTTDFFISPCSINSTNFSNNTAATSGGAIYSETVPPVLNISTISFSNNKAQIYGNDLGAYGVLVTAWQPSSSPMPIQYNATMPNQASSPPPQPSTLNFSVALRSGVQDYALYFALYDMYGQLYTEDSSSEIYLVPQFPNTTNTSNLEVFAMSPGRATASQGIYTFPSGTEIIFMPNSSLNVTPISSGVQYAEQWGIPTSQLTLQFNPCMPGEVIGDANNFTCYVCPPSTYSVNPQDKTCQSCDPNAVCLGGEWMCPLPGYWRMNSTADIIAQCPNQNSCLGSPLNLSNATITGNCQVGHQGPLCDVCQPGYGKYGNEHHCYNCHNDGWYYGRILVTFFVDAFAMIWMIVDVLIITEHDREPRDIKNLRIRRVGYWKNLFQFSQRMRLLGAIVWNWGYPAVENTVNVASSLSFTFVEIFGWGCLLSGDQEFYVKSFLSILLPLVIMGITMLLIYVPWENIFVENKYQNRASGCGEWLKRNRRGLIGVLMIMMVYFEWGAVYTAATYLGSRNLYSNNNYLGFLVVAPEVSSSSVELLLWIIAVAIPVLVIWGCIAPAVFIRIFRKNSEKIITDEFQWKYGSLCMGYKPYTPLAAWDLHYMLVKTVLALVFNGLMVAFPGGSVVLYIGILVTMMQMQNMMKPYEDEVTNTMEMYGLGSCLVLCLCASYYYVGSFGVWMDVLVAIVGIASIIAFGIVWLLNFLRLLAVMVGGNFEKVLFGLIGNPEGLAKEASGSGLRSPKVEHQTLLSSEMLVMDLHHSNDSGGRRRFNVPGEAISPPRSMIEFGSKEEIKDEIMVESQVVEPQLKKKLSSSAVYEYKKKESFGGNSSPSKEILRKKTKIQEDPMELDESEGMDVEDPFDKSS